MNTTGRSFDEDYGGWKDFNFIKDEFHFVIFALFIVAVNSCVIIAVCRCQFLRKSENYLLASLAVSDLSTGLISLPLLMLCSFSPYSECMSCYTSFMFTRLLSISSILHLVAVALQRYLLVVRPYYHRRVRANDNRVKVVIVCLWSVSLIVAAVPFSWLRKDSCLKENDGKFGVVYAITCLVVFFLLPTVLLIYVFGCIFMVARGHIRKQESRLTFYASEPQEERSMQSTMYKEARVAIIFMVMWLVFLVCWSPYFILNLMDELGMEPILAMWIFDGANTLRFLTSLLNPLLYSFLKEDFHQALRLDRVINFLKCRWSLPCNPCDFTRHEPALHDTGDLKDDQPSCLHDNSQEEFTIYISTV